MNMEPKFKIGQKVVVVDVEGSYTNGISNGDILTVDRMWQDDDGCFCYGFKGSGYALREHRLKVYVPNKTAEEISPTLWTAYKDILNEEALAALRQVIEDVEDHEKIDFKDYDEICYAFTWRRTKQGYCFWNAVDNGEYNKTSETTTPELQDKSEEDTGSAATSKAVKSDGGSSDYYKISVKTSHGMANVEVNDLIYALVGGDFDLGNCIKACRRMYLASKGCGKEGVDSAYDVNKCKWFLDDFQMRFGNGNNIQ